MVAITFDDPDMQFLLNAIDPTDAINKRVYVNFAIVDLFIAINETHILTYKKTIIFWHFNEHATQHRPSYTFRKDIRGYSYSNSLKKFLKMALDFTS